MFFCICRKKILQECIVLLRNHFLIEDMVIFIHEIYAPEAFHTRETITQIMTFAAVITVLTPEERMTIIAVTNLITVFALMDKGTIDTVLCLLKPATVFTKLII